MTYLRFGIRDLLWAMVVVGLIAAWWIKSQSEPDKDLPHYGVGATPVELPHLTD